MSGNVYLVGMMGSGKSSVSKSLARKLKRGRCDLDALIVEREGMSISDIFRFHGESHFRQSEKTVLELIARKQGMIVATGGGVVLEQANRAIMKKTGVVVYLKASVEVLYERVKYDQSRPLLCEADPKEKLAALFDERRLLYEEASIVIDTEQKTPDAIADEIIDRLGREVLL